MINIKNYYIIPVIILLGTIMINHEIMIICAFCILIMTFIMIFAKILNYHFNETRNSIKNNIIKSIIIPNNNSIYQQITNLYLIENILILPITSNFKKYLYKSLSVNITKELINFLKIHN